MNHSIPRIIHQTWRNTEIPERWQGFQRSWLRHNQNWQYRLWTDLDLRQLISEHYAWFLPIFDNYPEQIQRVDAVRYFIMHRHGGVYVDLDFECLRPLEPLMGKRDLIIGHEPGEHLDKAIVRSEGFEQVVCNAFLASKPSHPFWEHVFFQMIATHRMPGPLNSTGPLMLTRAVQSYHDPAALECLPSRTLYPGTSEEAKAGLLVDENWRARNTSESFAIHHWSGSWISSQPAQKAQTRLPITLMSQGRFVMEGYCADSDHQVSITAPQVSCLMVTDSRRLSFIKKAIACYLAQSYPAKELIIVDDGESSELARYLEELQEPSVQHVRLSSERFTLGRLRNIAVARATGEYIMQWDDDDLYHPRRIETQMNALRAVDAEACLLSRWKIWWPMQRRIATSKKRAWEGSLLCAKSKMPSYDEFKRRGEDTPAILRLVSSGKVVFLDAPWLYTYIVHGANTTAESNLEAQWAQASQFYWGKTYPSVLRSIASKLPQAIKDEIELSLANGADSVADDSPQISVRIRAEPSTKQRHSNPSTHEKPPRVLILSPVKNGKALMSRYFAGLKRLSYPRERLSLALLESDSVDGTHASLCAKADELRDWFARVEIFKRDYGFRLEVPRTATQMQLQRRSILARSRNYLLTRALQEEDWVLWLDFDVVDYPPDLIQRLLSKERSIVVPHCVIAPGGRTFDLNTFIRSTQDPSEDLVRPGELAQPERGIGRTYLENMRDRDLVEVHGVGGTVLLVKADLHREGLIFPVAPYKNHIETEGLSFLARDMGVSSWGAPQIEVVHANR